METIQFLDREIELLQHKLKLAVEAREGLAKTLEFFRAGSETNGQFLTKSNRFGSRLTIDDDLSEREFKRDGSPRPDGVPATPDMVMAILKLAYILGKPGLAPIAVVNEIDRLFWPGVGYNSIVPVMSRMVREGRIKRNDGIYFLNREDKERLDSIKNDNFKLNQELSIPPHAGSIISRNY